MSHTSKVSGLQVKLFLGCTCSSEIKLALSQSLEWAKSALSGNTELKLELCHKEEKDYIGLFIAEQLSLPEIRAHEERILARLKVLCPQLDLESERLAFCIFSQVFIA